MPSSRKLRLTDIKLRRSHSYKIEELRLMPRRLELLLPTWLSSHTIFLPWVASDIVHWIQGPMCLFYPNQGVPLPS